MKTSLRPGLMLIVWLGLGAPAVAQVRAAESMAAPDAAGSPAEITSPTAEPRDWFGLRPWTEWGTVTGDWNRARTWLGSRGVTTLLAETADISRVPTPGGGQAQAMRGLFDATLAFDDRLLRAPGSSAAVQIQWLPGDNGSALLGDLQGFSNVDAEDVPWLGEAWYQQQFGSRVRAKVGRVDANSEFAYVNASSDFLSAALGFSPSIVAMPTYPTPSSSVSLFVQPLSGVEIGGGVFNGTPEDGRLLSWTSRFAIAQVAAAWTGGDGGLQGRVSAGGWQHRGPVDEGADVGGVFLTAEQTIWTAAERRGTVFAQVGASDSRSPVRRHLSGGLALRGASSRRRLDVTGIGATWVQLVADESSTASEVSVEAFHRLVVTPSVSIIPDLQVIRHPSGDRTRGMAAALTCRLRFDF